MPIEVLTMEIIKEFAEYLKINGKRKGGKFSDKSIKSYCDDVQSFLVHYSKPLHEVTENDAYQFLMLDSESTALRKFSSLKRFYDFALGKHLVDTNFFSKELFNKLRRVPSRVKEYLSVEDGSYFLEKAKQNKAHYAMMMVYLNTGMRESELINLNKNDLSSYIDGGEIKYRLKIIRKGNKEGYVGIGQGVKAAIDAYYTTRTDNLPYMFVSSQGGRYSTSGVYTVVKAIAKRAYLDNVHPHALRDAFAGMMHDQGKDAFDIKETLGHKNIQTTMKYLTRLGDKRMQQIAEDSAWANG
jgi:site-specific recombinase XerD